jgi:hypothetical protein
MLYLRNLPIGSWDYIFLHEIILIIMLRCANILEIRTTAILLPPCANASSVPTIYTLWPVTSSILDEVIGVLNWPNPSSHTMALESTQPLTEMSTRNLPGGKGWLVCEADNLTAICEPII